MAKDPDQNNLSDSAAAASPPAALLVARIPTYSPSSCLTGGAHPHPRSWSIYIGQGPKVRRALAITLLASLPVAHSETALRTIDISTPRSFGYVIGDIVEQRVRLELNSPFRLDETLLPKPGRLNRWLDRLKPVVETSHHASASVYDVMLAYQIRAVPERLEEITIPQQELVAVHEGTLVPVIVNQWQLSVSPIVPEATAQSSVYSDLRPDRPPPEAETRPREIRLSIALTLIATLLTYLSWTYWSQRWGTRGNAPFALALRQLRSLRRTPTTSAYRQGLRVVHEAFNRTAGGSLFLEHLDAFFEERPVYTDLRERIEALYAKSRDLFFSPRDRSEPTASELTELVQLVRDLRELERKSP